MCRARFLDRMHSPETDDPTMYGDGSLQVGNTVLENNGSFRWVWDVNADTGSLDVLLLLGRCQQPEGMLSPAFRRPYTTPLVRRVW